jgi:hypothetical protein
MTNQRRLQAALGLFFTIKFGAIPCCTTPGGVPIAHAYVLLAALACCFAHVVAPDCEQTGRADSEDTE